MATRTWREDLLRMFEMGTRRSDLNGFTVQEPMVPGQKKAPCQRMRPSPLQAERHRPSRLQAERQQTVAVEAFPTWPVPMLAMMCPRQFCLRAGGLLAWKKVAAASKVSRWKSESLFRAEVGHEQGGLCMPGTLPFVQTQKAASLRHIHVGREHPVLRAMHLRSFPLWPSMQQLPLVQAVPALGR